MTQAEFNAMLQVAIADGLPGGSFTMKYSWEEIEALLSGKGMEFLGRYDTVDDVPDPVEGGHYYIGTETPYHVYTYISGVWVDAGTMKGPKGDKGDPFTYDDFTPEQLDDLERGAKAAQAAAETAAAESATAAQSAQSGAEAAQSAAAQALSSQKAAASSASNAATSKTVAKASETAAGKSATESQSWAVGGTGTRAGENTNNAKYWSTVAMGAAGGGVTTFNGRFGAVVPQTGDYTPSMVGAAPESLVDRVRLMEYMMTHNDYVAPLATDDADLTVLVDDNNNAILADWHYKEV